MSSEREIVKVKPPENYPPEEGRYLRGNDYSPVAVVVILRWPAEETPPSIEALVRAGVESGAALSGTLQTENIGLEKVICNIVANPNIRYLVVCGPESEGHQVGQTIAALMTNGVNEKRLIIGSNAHTPYLYNIPIESIERFRKQVTFIDLINEGNPDLVRKAVWSCYQEEPVEFRGYRLYDPGAYPEPPLCGKITWRVTQPWYQPRDEAEQKAKQRMEQLLADIKQRQRRRGMDSDQL
jgi:tetrahydromethanopterin S-methyltransferase subunit A